ncbi:MAG: NUDIX domain-containing protein [Candidatus Lambdaproteobacteria bacterium]|nr:NUDIX domain-containing protein [Candidatus Lambdaproteobacteria bacterium]
MNGGRGYRRNVCGVIADAREARVLVFRRADLLLGAQVWQFPQGGLEPDEAPLAGLLRELREEIGTADVTVLRAAPHPIRYEFPADVLARVALADPAKAGYIGQEQNWFLVRLNGGTEAIHFDHQPAEFNAFRWVTPADAVTLVVEFKTAAYRAGLRALGLLP